MVEVRQIKRNQDIINMCIRHLNIKTTIRQLRKQSITINNIQINSYNALLVHLCRQLSWHLHLNCKPMSG